MENNTKNGFITNLLKKKTPDEIMENANRVNLKRTLNAFDLIMLGIGVMIGSGIFTALGIAAVGSNFSSSSNVMDRVSFVRERKRKHHQ